MKASVDGFDLLRHKPPCPADLFMDRVRSQIKITGPAQRAEKVMGENLGITQGLEHASIGRVDESFQVNVAFRVIVETTRKVRRPVMYRLITAKP